MKKANFLLTTIALVTLPTPVCAQEVSFERDILPTLARRCGACHITGEEPGKMALVPGRAYASLVNQQSVEVPDMKRIAPGDPEASYMVHKLEGTHLSVGGNGVRMPMHQGPLPKSMIAKVRAWVAAGALDN